MVHTLAMEVKKIARVLEQRQQVALFTKSTPTMSRSVSYLSHALGITYFHAEFEDELLFEDAITEALDTLQQHYPSISGTKRWAGREEMIFAENSHCEIGISEYHGLISISIRIRESDYTNYELASEWIARNWPKMKERIADTFPGIHLRKIGTFSNGESVFEKIAA